jgi:hypothetical protein
LSGYVVVLEPQLWTLRTTLIPRRSLHAVFNNCPTLELITHAYKSHLTSIHSSSLHMSPLKIQPLEHLSGINVLKASSQRSLLITENEFEEDGTCFLPFILGL